MREVEFFKNNMGKSVKAIHTAICAMLFGTAVFLCGCNENETGDTISNRQIIDMAGREVRVPKKVERIVCKGPGTLRLITYLQATDKVVGIEGGFEKTSPKGRPYRIAHPELAELPAIGRAGPSPQADSEAVLKVRPEVIFISYARGRIVENLQSATGIPVVVLGPGPLGGYDTESFFRSLKIAGEILDREKRADEVINFIEGLENELRQRIAKSANTRKPGVYVGGLGYKGSHGITSTQIGYPGFELLDVNSVTDKLQKQGHISVSKEKILQWNPDVIFVDGNGLGMVLADYRKNPEFYRSLKAARENRVHLLLPYNFYSTNLSTALANYFYIGKVLSENAFADINPEEKADKIYSFLVGKPVFSKMQKDFGGFRKLNLMGKISVENR